MVRLFLIFVLLAGHALAQGNARPSDLPGDIACPGPEEWWTEVERWAWDQICLGREADLSEQFGMSGANCGLETTVPLSARFLTLILTEEPWATASPSNGVVISCAHVDEPLDLRARTIRADVAFKSTIFSSLDLTDAHFIRSLSIDGKIDRLDGESLRVDGSLTLSLRGIGQELAGIFAKYVPEAASKFENIPEGATAAEINLPGATIGGNMKLNLFFQKLRAERLKVAGSLSAPWGGGGVIADIIILTSAEIGGDLAGNFSVKNFFADDVTVGGSLQLKGSRAGNKRRLPILIGGEGALHLARARIGQSINLSDGAFDGDVNMWNARIGSDFNAKNAGFAGKLTLSNADIANSLNLSGTEFDGDVYLWATKIGSDFEAKGARFNGPLSASNMDVAGNVDLRPLPRSRRTWFLKDVWLQGAKVGGKFNAWRAYFYGKLDAEDIQVARDLTLSRGEFVGDVVLADARVGLNLHATDATFRGRINMVRARIGADLRASGSTFMGRVDGKSLDVSGDLLLDRHDKKKDAGEAGAEKKPVQKRAVARDVLDISGAKIGGTVFLGGGRFDALVDLGGAELGGLTMDRTEDGSSADPAWGADASLNLRDTHANVLEAAVSSWRRDGADGNEWVSADLVGFDYARLGGVDKGGRTSMVRETGDKLVEWLKGVGSGINGKVLYAPGPYEHLTGLLLREGMESKAKTIGYAKFEHRSDAPDPETPWYEKFIVWPVSKHLVGYGVYPFRALRWFVVLVVLGAAVAAFSRDRERMRGASDWLWYSVENAIPLVELSDRYKNVQHGAAWIDGFYHMQKLLGFVLATYLLGALTFLAESGGPQ